MEKFNEDMILQDMAFHRDLNKWASHARIQRVREESLREGKQEGLREGKQEGLREGKQEGLKYSVLKLFQKRKRRKTRRFKIFCIEIISKKIF